MRTTSNPVIRNLLISTGSPPPRDRGDTADKRPVHLRPATGADRPLTVDDVVTKTGLALAVVVATAFLTVVLELQVLALPALLAGLGLTLYSMLRPRPIAALTIGYSVAEGIVLGAVTELFEWGHPGIARQAVIGTCGVFLGMLIVYQTRVLRVTPKITRWFIVAALGAIVLTAVDVAALVVFHTDLGVRGGSVLSIVLTAVFIAIAAVSLLLNFDAADQMIRLGVSEKWAWYLAFGLIAALVWLYLEILWLLSPFQ